MVTARRAISPLVPYARRYWPANGRSLLRSSGSFNLSQPFYDSHSQVRKSWLAEYPSLGRQERPLVYSPLLHVALYFGVLPLAEAFFSETCFLDRIDRLTGVTVKESTGKTASHWAAMGGQLPWCACNIVLLL